jgi:ABC-2 type transport system ATP-binding protein
MKRRLTLARALINDPDVLIMDEPTDGLDPNQKHDMRELIRAMAPGKAIVVSTHILEEVDAVCSRAIIIAAGKIVADATPSELVARAAGQQAVRLRVATTSPDLAIERLRPIVGEARLEVVERASGAISLLLFGSGLAPATLSGELVKADLAIEEIGVWRPRLEDVFRSITSPANDSAPAAGTAPADEKPAA